MSSFFAQLGELIKGIFNASEEDRRNQIINHNIAVATQYQDVITTAKFKGHSRLFNNQWLYFEVDNIRPFATTLDINLRAINGSPNIDGTHKIVATWRPSDPEPFNPINDANQIKVAWFEHGGPEKAMLAINLPQQYYSTDINLLENQIFEAYNPAGVGAPQLLEKSINEKLQALKQLILSPENKNYLIGAAALLVVIIALYIFNEE